MAAEDRVGAMGAATLSPWACARCTFENESLASQCQICLHKRPMTRVASNPRGTPPKMAPSTRQQQAQNHGDAMTPSPPPTKRAKISPGSENNKAHGSGGMQSMLISVGSSQEQAAKRVDKKLQQLRVLGIDLPREELLALLAKNCYCVHVAASEYFERLAMGASPASSTSRSMPTPPSSAMTKSQSKSQTLDGASLKEDALPFKDHDAQITRPHQQERVGAPYLLLGTTIMHGSITRARAQLTVGDHLRFQGENVGKKRGRPSASNWSAASKTTASSGSAASLSAPTATGVVRVSTSDQVQIGRLERATEIIFYGLLREGLVCLTGECMRAPPRGAATVFASFSVKVSVYVHPQAFEIFDETHKFFHLSDPLYTVLESIHSGTAGRTTLTSALAASSLTATSDSVDLSGEDEEEAVPHDLDALFSAFVPDQHGEDGDTLGQQLAPSLNGIELRSHQKQALSWMLCRETLPEPTARPTTPTTKAEDDAHAAATDADIDTNPLWEKRFFESQEPYYINPFEKVASLLPPEPPSPCRGGILADDMGMGKTMMLLSLIAHRKLFGDGKDTQTKATVRTATTVRNSRGRGRGGKSTLIVCPLSLLHQWKNEVQDRFKAQTLSVFVYYGDERDMVASSGSRFTHDIVLTTYGVLSSEFEKKSTTSALMTTLWTRVILDEAHSIKNRSTGYFRACSALQASHRWCLTGTPLQNSISDLFSLLSFLQYTPWSRVAWWHRVIAVPFEQGDESALARLKVILKPILLRRTKNSRDGAGNRIVELPAKKIEWVKLTFTAEERAFYQAVFDRSRADFNGFVASGTSMSSYVAIFALLLRLRQACDHPFLALGRSTEQMKSTTASAAEASTSDGSSSLLQRLSSESMEAYFRRIAIQLQPERELENTAETKSSGLVVKGDTSVRRSSGTSTTSLYVQNVLTQIQEEGLAAQECPVCLDPPLPRGVLTPCAHLLCEDCLRASLANDPDGGCPVCRVPIDMTCVYSLSNDTSSAPPADADAATPLPSSVEPDSSSSLTMFVSTKLRRLLQDLNEVRAANALESDPSQRRKVVVFSQWTHMLDMVTELLSRHEIGHHVFHGAMSNDQRERVLHAFATDDKVEVLAISLRAGGVGLNLTRASVVILLDPWWNPGVEDQAIDRVHRLGQTQRVDVKRYIVEGTVEDMILQLQQRKAALANNVLVAAKTGDERASENLRMEDLLAFFK